MKRIEKLASDFAYSLPADDPFGMRERYAELVQVGYRAGFRAAREMAAKEAEELANPKSVVDDSFGEHIAEAIRELGEDEVGD